MTRPEVIQKAAEMIPMCHSDQALFALLDQVYQCGLDSITHGQMIRVYSDAGLYDNQKHICHKFGYDPETVRTHLKNGKPTERGHVFKYA